MNVTHGARNWFLKCLASLAAVCSALLLPACTNLVFHPMRPHVFDPKTAGIVHEDRTFLTDDGVVLHGWWLPARQAGRNETGAPAGTVIFLHGNAENISTHIASIHWLPNAGYNVYLYDYRGFGKSAGAPDFELTRVDVRRAIDIVSEFPEAKGRPLFLFGQSLGGAIIVSSLGGQPDRLRVDGIVIEGAPSSLRTAAREALGNHWLTWPFQHPLSWLISDSNSPADRVGAIAPTPLMIIHSRDDRVVRFRHGEILQAAAPANRVWHPTSGRHIAALQNPNDRRAFIEFLEQAARQRTLRSAPTESKPAAGD